MMKMKMNVIILWHMKDGQFDLYKKTHNLMLTDEVTVFGEFL